MSSAAPNARRLINITIGKVSVVERERRAVGDALEAGPRHHAWIKIAPRCGCAGTSGVSDNQKLPDSQHAQAILTIEHTHVFVVIAAAAAFTEPYKLRQAFDDVIALAFEKFLRADDVRIFSAKHGRDEIAPERPSCLLRRWA